MKQQASNLMRPTQTVKRLHAGSIVCQPGNLLVNGGTSAERLQLLVRHLNRGPAAVVFASEEETAAIASAAAQGRFTKHVVFISSGCPNYDPLCGMSPAAVAAFLSRAADILGFRDRASLIAYYSAVAQFFPDGPRSFLELHRFVESHTDADLGRQAMETGQDRLYQRLISAGSGSQALRDVLEILALELKPLCSPSRLSALTAAGHDMILVVSPPAGCKPELLSELFSAELDGAAGGLRLVVMDTQLVQEDRFRDTMDRYKGRGCLSVLTANLMNLKRPTDLQSGCGCQVHLLEGLDTGSLQKALDYFGTFTFYEETTTTSTPMEWLHWFSLERSVSRGLTPVTRPRVLATELGGYEAVCIGPLQDLVCVRNLIL